MNECTLGIDVGTTSIEAALVDAITFEVIQSSKHVHKARVQSNSDVNVSAEQCPKVILRTLQKCMSELNQENLRFVTRIGITGQMHGVMFWRKHADFGDLYFCNQSEENDV
ncbi:SHPK (predicted) [Pycnogonum litorale]